jgi:Ni,Fe-hydrogenase III large subunit
VTGGLHLQVALSGAVVRAARLRSQRPVSLCQILLGRPAAELPAAVERLHALCGRAHRLAAGFALDAARGHVPTDAARRAAVRELAAERIGEHLRSSFTTAVGLGFPTTPVEKDALRAALMATRPGATDAGLTPALARLGLDRPPPSPASWAARMLDAAGPAEDGAGLVDALSPADDPAVLAGLAGSGLAFAALPQLPRRRPETGPLARRPGPAPPHSRLPARFAEIAQAAALLNTGAEAAPDCWIASGTLPDGSGFAAVETPRGRMHYLLAVDTRDRLARCAVLAPTEWNFHPDGPLVRALTDLRAGAGVAAEVRIRWLVGLFDPCVACTIELTEEKLTEAELTEGADA